MKFKKKLITWFLVRFTDYFEIKSKNQELLKDMYDITMKEESIEAATAKIKWITIFRMEESLMIGNALNIISPGHPLYIPGNTQLMKFKK